MSTLTKTLLLPVLGGLAMLTQSCAVPATGSAKGTYAYTGTYSPDTAGPGYYSDGDFGYNNYGYPWVYPDVYGAGFHTDGIHRSFDYSKHSFAHFGNHKAHSTTKPKPKDTH